MELLAERYRDPPGLQPGVASTLVLVRSSPTVLATQVQIGSKPDPVGMSAPADFAGRGGVAPDIRSPAGHDGAHLDHSLVEVDARGRDRYLDPALRGRPLH